MSDGRPNQLELPFDAAPPSARPKAPKVSEQAGGPTRQAVRALAAGAPPSPRSSLRVIQGGGQRKIEPLTSRDAVVRVLIEAGADLLLRRISPVRAEEIEVRVERILDLFDQVEGQPDRMATLERELSELEALMQTTRATRRVHAR